MLPSETFEIRKGLSTLFLAKSRYNTGENVKPYGLYISGDLRYFTNSFFSRFRTIVKSDY
jgi:hypothetical protein